MNCSRLVELITDYLEGALPEEERALAERAPRRAATAARPTSSSSGPRSALTGMLTEEQIPPEAREALLGVFRDWRTTA